MIEALSWNPLTLSEPIIESMLQVNSNLNTLGVYRNMVNNASDRTFAATVSQIIDNLVGWVANRIKAN
jgi:hypothetical protein